ncbi:hypothetical protein SteCoe_17890 [Stentor coeruleus]|uniref:DUF8206 domain-containing protein n=1 Tax=Stentor coeruleus TaxID=5963 RepID=A0A1R2BYB5_9CILI|nr:hypothetical protein SteCoe_17890 [Stentor coeruleus]
MGCGKIGCGNFFFPEEGNTEANLVPGNSNSEFQEIVNINHNIPVLADLLDIESQIVMSEDIEPYDPQSAQIIIKELKDWIDIPNSLSIPSPTNSEQRESYNWDLVTKIKMKKKEIEELKIISENFQNSITKGENVIILQKWTDTRNLNLICLNHNSICKIKCALEYKKHKNEVDYTKCEIFYESFHCRECGCLANNHTHIKKKPLLKSNNFESINDAKNVLNEMNKNIIKGQKKIERYCQRIPDENYDIIELQPHLESISVNPTLNIDNENININDKDALAINAKILILQTVIANNNLKNIENCLKNKSVKVTNQIWVHSNSIRTICINNLTECDNKLHKGTWRNSSCQQRGCAQEDHINIPYRLIQTEISSNNPLQLNNQKNNIIQQRQECINKLSSFQDVIIINYKEDKNFINIIERINSSKTSYSKTILTLNQSSNNNKLEFINTLKINIAYCEIIIENINEIQNCIKNSTFDLKISKWVDTNYHNTVCATHKVICHEMCSLNYNNKTGTTLFLSCACFNNYKYCNNCGCQSESHMHVRKKLVIKTKNMKRKSVLVTKLEKFVQKKQIVQKELKKAQRDILVAYKNDQELLELNEKIIFCLNYNEENSVVAVCSEVEMFLFINEVKIKISEFEALLVVIKKVNYCIKSSTKILNVEKWVDTNNHNTVCFFHKTICHENCKLEFNDKAGTDYFLKCASFGNSSNCRKCKCKSKTHMHLRKKIAMTTQTFQNINEVRIEYKKYIIQLEVNKKELVVLKEKLLKYNCTDKMYFILIEKIEFCINYKVESIDEIRVNNVQPNSNIPSNNIEPSDDIRVYNVQPRNNIEPNDDIRVYNVQPSSNIRVNNIEPNDDIRVYNLQRNNNIRQLSDDIRVYNMQPNNNIRVSSIEPSNNIRVNNVDQGEIMKFINNLKEKIAEFDVVYINITQIKLAVTNSSDNVKIGEWVDTNWHNTICTFHKTLCHEKCGLDFNENTGTNYFINCYSFQRASKCRICNCGSENHMHSRKKFIEKNINVKGNDKKIETSINIYYVRFMKIKQVLYKYNQLYEEYYYYSNIDQSLIDKLHICLSIELEENSLSINSYKEKIDIIEIMNKVKLFIAQIETISILIETMIINIKENTLKVEISKWVDTPYHNTVCFSHKTICHEKCGLSYHDKTGTKYFLNCASFSSSKTCNKCGCDSENHMHVRKILQNSPENFPSISNMVTYITKLNEKRKILLEEFTLIIQQMIKVVALNKISGALHEKIILCLKISQNINEVNHLTVRNKPEFTFDLINDTKIKIFEIDILMIKIEELENCNKFNSQKINTVIWVDTNIENTVCLVHRTLCHESCGLFITNGISSNFLCNCVCFIETSYCKECRCLPDFHVLIKKKLIHTVEIFKTKEEISNSLYRYYQQLETICEDLKKLKNILQRKNPHLNVLKAIISKAESSMKKSNSILDKRKKLIVSNEGKFYLFNDLKLKISELESYIKNEKSMMKSIRNSHFVVHVEEWIEVDYHSTVCSSHKKICHEDCSLEYIEKAGDEAFLDCGAFKNLKNCISCGCEYIMHMHIKKINKIEAQYYNREEIEFKCEEITNEIEIRKTTLLEVYRVVQKYFTDDDIPNYIYQRVQALCF